MTPTARELLDMVACKDGNMANQTEAGHVLASRVEAVLALPQETERPGGGPESEHWHTKGYNAALRDVLALLNGEKP